MPNTSTARTPRKKTLETRRRIREAAKQLFAERGFDATSVQAIGDVVGMGKQAVRYHYPSKEQLRREVYEEMAAKWADFIPRLLKALVGPDATRERLIDELVELVDDEPHLAPLVLRDMLEGDSLAKAMAARDFIPHLERSFEEFQELKEAGIIRDDVDPAAAYVVLLHTIVPVLALATRRSRFENEANDDWRRIRIREAFRLLRNGLFAEATAN